MVSWNLRHACLQEVGVMQILGDRDFSNIFLARQFPVNILE